MLSSATFFFYLLPLITAVALPQIPSLSGIPSFGGDLGGGLPSLDPTIPSLGGNLGDFSPSVPIGLSSPSSGLGFGTPSIPFLETIPSLPPATLSGTTDLTTRDGCTDYMLIFARGTTELQGFGSVGGPLDTALKAKFSSYSSYAVVYPAAFNQNSASGSADAL